MSKLSTILYIPNKKVKKAALKRLKFKTIFLYTYAQPSRTYFFNKLIPSDLLML